MLGDALHSIGYALWCVRGFVKMFVVLSLDKSEPDCRISPLTALDVAWGIWASKARQHHCDCHMARYSWGRW